jgi:hypothetical protein
VAKAPVTEAPVVEVEVQEEAPKATRKKKAQEEE